MEIIFRRSGILLIMRLLPHADQYPPDQHRPGHRRKSPPGLGPFVAASKAARLFSRISGLPGRLWITANRGVMMGFCLTREPAMGVTEPGYSVQPSPACPPRSRNGLGVATLVIGVASLVAGLSFVLFPLALLGGLVGLIIGIIALSGGRARGATSRGQAIAGLICCVLALIIAIDLSVHVGTWAARKTSVFTRFEKCIAQAGNWAAVRPASPSSPTMSVPDLDRSVTLAGRAGA